MPTLSQKAWCFRDELARWGPQRHENEVPSLEVSRRYCRELARRHYENFTVVSWLLPRRLHPHFYHVYAYCRWADDLADEPADPQTSLHLLAWWRDEFERCVEGRPRHPVMIALRETIDRFAIPYDLFLDLLIAFEQDQRVREYNTYDQLLEYCRYSANPVGRLVLFLCECFDAERAKLADCICTGLQLANFWQDVAGDLDRGRIYLPQEDRNRFGYDDAALRSRTYNCAFRQLMAFEVDRARRWFHAGLPLAERVPRRLRVDIELFARGGLAILDKIAGVDYDVWQRRPTVSRREQIQLLAGCATHAALVPRANGAVKTPPWNGSKAHATVPLGDVRERSGTAGKQTCGPATTSRRRSRRRDLDASYAHCHQIARHAARNFYPAFLLLPTEQRRAMCALYAFLRRADDIGDSRATLANRRRSLNGWRESLERALEGTYDDPILPALHDTVASFDIPPAYLRAVLDGVKMDLDGARYETFDDLYVYCYRVAVAVGLACLHIWGISGGGRSADAQNAAAHARAEQCGVAFQLTNILRDVQEDALMGRVYLPQQDLTKFRCDTDALRTGRPNERLRELLRFETERAGKFYDRGAPLASQLAPAGRRAFRALFGIYRRLLDEIERRDYDVFSRPVNLTPAKKLAALTRAMVPEITGVEFR